MENIPMLTENALIGIVVPLAGIVLFAGLFLWIITGRNKRLSKQDAEEMEKYMGNLPIDCNGDAVDPDKYNEYLKSLDNPVRDVDGLTQWDRNLRKRLGPIISEHSYDAFDYSLPRRDTSIGKPYDKKHVHLDFNPKGSSWAEKYIDKEEHILDKINRLHKEMQECLPVENYERMAEIKKELNELYEAEPPKDFKS